MFRFAIAFLLAAFWGDATLRADQLVTISTVLGPIVVHLFEADKPVTAGNFLSYVNSGAYTDTFIQRWEPGFVIQGGGWKTLNGSLARLVTFGTITNEYSVGRNFPNTYGTIAMARVGGFTNSASSQWFINLSDQNTFLDKVDGGFTVFGRVVGGTNVVNLFRAAPDAKTLSITNLDLLFQRDLGLTKTPFIAPINDVVFSDFSVRQDFGVFDSVLQSSKTKDEVVLKWKTIKDKPHTLQFTDSQPPVWQTFTNFVGNGETAFFTNSITSAPKRFFRMRVDLQ